jgi:hypothetical protein
VTDDNGIKPVRVHFSEGTIRDLNTAMDAYERRNTEAHTAIVSQLNKYNSQSAVLKVLGILVLTVIGTAIGLIVRAEGIVDDLQDEIADVRREEQGNAKEGFAMARSMQREIDECKVDLKQLQRFHGMRPGKD